MLMQAYSIKRVFNLLPLAFVAATFFIPLMTFIYLITLEAITQTTFKFTFIKYMTWCFIGLTGFIFLIRKYILKSENRIAFLRVKNVMSLVGLMVALMFSGILFGAIAYLLLPIDGWYIWTLRSGYVIGLITWCCYKFLRFRNLVIEKKFMEREFTVLEDRIVMRIPSKTNIESKFNKNRFMAKAVEVAAPFLVVLFVMAYPLQRALVMADSGGYQGVLIFFLVFCWLGVYYFAAKLCCGFYLYIYKISELEKLHDKPVVFDESAYEND